MRTLAAEELTSVSHKILEEGMAGETDETTPTLPPAKLGDTELSYSVRHAPPTDLISLPATSQVETKDSSKPSPPPKDGGLDRGSIGPVIKGNEESVKQIKQQVMSLH